MREKERSVAAANAAAATHEQILINECTTITDSREQLKKDHSAAATAREQILINERTTVTDSREQLKKYHAATVAAIITAAAAREQILVRVNERTTAAASSSREKLKKDHATAIAAAAAGEQNVMKGYAAATQGTLIKERTAAIGATVTVTATGSAADTGTAAQKRLIAEHTASAAVSTKGISESQYSAPFHVAILAPWHADTGVTQFASNQQHLNRSPVLTPAYYDRHGHGDEMARLEEAQRLTVIMRLESVRESERRSRQTQRSADAAVARRSAIASSTVGAQKMHHPAWKLGVGSVHPRAS